MEKLNSKQTWKYLMENFDESINYSDTEPFNSKA
jgi:hypothetical protein